MISRNFLLFFMVVYFGMGLSHSVSAQGQNPQAENSEVLNFDVDVIVGDKQVPDIMFRSSSESIDFEAMLHTRSDFNDFLKGDAKRVPDFLE